MDPVMAMPSDCSVEQGHSLGPLIALHITLVTICDLSAFLIWKQTQQPSYTRTYPLLSDHNHSSQPSNKNTSYLDYFQTIIMAYLLHLTYSSLCCFNLIHLSYVHCYKSVNVNVELKFQTKMSNLQLYLISVCSP